MRRAVVCWGMPWAEWEVGKWYALISVLQLCFRWLTSEEAPVNGTTGELASTVVPERLRDALGIRVGLASTRRGERDPRLTWSSRFALVGCRVPSLMFGVAYGWERVRGRCNEVVGGDFRNPLTRVFADALVPVIPVPAAESAWEVDWRWTRYSLPPLPKLYCPSFLLCRKPETEKPSAAELELKAFGGLSSVIDVIEMADMRLVSVLLSFSRPTKNCPGMLPARVVLQTHACARQAQPRHPTMVLVNTQTEWAPFQGDNQFQRRAPDNQNAGGQVGEQRAKRKEKGEMGISAETRLHANNKYPSFQFICISDNSLLTLPLISDDPPLVEHCFPHDHEMLHI